MKKENYEKPVMVVYQLDEDLCDGIKTGSNDPEAKRRNISSDEPVKQEEW